MFSTLKIKLWLRLVASISLGLLASVYLSSCEPNLPANTQLYQVDGALACDYARVTASPLDDCDYVRQPPGYYYHGGRSVIFYRTNQGERLEIERPPINRFPQPGNVVPLNQPVITDQAGAPLLNEGRPVRGNNPVSNSGNPNNGRQVTTVPVRSTASFDHPTLGKVRSGRTTGTSRGMSFGNSGHGSG